MRALYATIAVLALAACGLVRPAALRAQTTGVGAGILFVGIDIAAPGTYRSGGGNSCYWERLGGFSGLPKDVLGSAIPVGPTLVTIEKTDEALRSFGCGAWTPAVARITTSPNAPFGDGTYQVGLDIAPGTWQAPGGSSCYWARLAAFSGAPSDIIASGASDGPLSVTIDSGDTGFVSQHCGAWTAAG